MRKKTVWRMLAAALALTFGLAAGCGRGAQETEGEPVGEEAQTDQADAEQEEEPPQEQDGASSEGFSFADVADREFYFSSGAGAWRTVLYIHEDGSFDGQYLDSDMGDRGDEYPYGTAYYSEFSGSFTQPEKVDEMTYRFRIDTLKYALDFGEEIKDGIYYHYVEAYGLADAEELYMYLPGSKIADLPEAYRSWVGYYNLDSMQETELSFYGLYNENAETGFSSYLMENYGLNDPETAEAEAQDWIQDIKEEIRTAETQAAELEAKLQNASSQGDMNQLSGEIYTVWDDALNTIWGIMTEHKDAETMEQELETERRWITSKEEAVQQAGADFEGGSMQPLVENTEAAKLSRNRVYELAAIAGADMETQIIYEGCYFDEGVYLYWTGEMEDASGFTYCEIWISNVTDTSFDFWINEIEAVTEKSTVLLPAGTAEILNHGRDAVYEGKDFTLTFHFELDPTSFPKDMTVEGWDKLEGNNYMNNRIPGHESG